ncbi:MAG: glycosyl transferase family 2, partial [Tepidisphaeraceae bacterium]
FVARMDSDDIALPHRFERQVAWLREHPECVLLGSNIWVCDPFCHPTHLLDQRATHEEIDAELIRGRGQALVHPTVMMRRDALLQAGRYNKAFDGAEDLDLFTRLAEVGTVANLKEPLLKYRHHLASENQRKFELQDRLIKRIVTEARQRRGLPDLNGAVQTMFIRPPPHVEQFLYWGWKALENGHVSAARSHAWGAWRRKPVSRTTLRLMYCALRGY